MDREWILQAFREPEKKEHFLYLRRLYRLDDTLFMSLFDEAVGYFGYGDKRLNHILFRGIYEDCENGIPKEYHRELTLAERLDRFKRIWPKTLPAGYYERSSANEPVRKALQWLDELESGGR